MSWLGSNWTKGRVWYPWTSWSSCKYLIILIAFLGKRHFYHLYLDFNPVFAFFYDRVLLVMSSTHSPSQLQQ